MEFANHCEEILSLKELSARAILSSRNCHHVVQMYDYCNVAGLNSLAAMAKKFMSDKFAFFLERFCISAFNMCISLCYIDSFYISLVLDMAKKSCDWCYRLKTLKICTIFMTVVSRLKSGYLSRYIATVKICVVH